MTTGDATLWERWQQSRDADAFTELVSRHAGMVYGTCRRVLSNATEAEDAAQECFIELMHARVFVAGSLGPWLHTVAVRRSRDRMRSETRRQRREERYADGLTTATETPVDDLLALIDEAVFSLPDKLKAPVVCRFLEGQSLETIAHTLGLPESTVRYRIDRGVERIRAFLRRRGVAVGAVALTSFLHTNLAEAAPATLVSVLGRLSLAGSAAPLPSAVGMAGIAGGILVMKKAVIALLVVLAVGAGLWGAQRWRADVAPKPAQVSVAPTPNVEVAKAPEGYTEPPSESAPGNADKSSAGPSPETTGGIPVAGHVVDRNGQPVEGAHVAAKTGDKAIVEAQSRADGAFRLGIELPSNELLLQASKDDYVSGVLGPLKLRDAGFSDLVLRLDTPRTARMSGSVVNSKGAPVSDLKLYFDHGAARGLLTKETTRTGADGAFEITNLAPGKCAIVPIAGDAGSGLLDNFLASMDLHAGEAVRGLRLVYDGREGLALAGRVINRKGEPVPGAFVQCHGQFSGQALTDASGAFRITGLAEGNTILTVVREGYSLGMLKDVKVGREDANITLGDLGKVAGRVTREDTGAAVLDFEVFCARGQAANEERARFADRQIIHESEGQFSISVSAGDAGITVRAKGLAPLTKVLKVNEGAATSCEFALKPGVRLEGQLVNRYSTPVSGALVFTGPLPIGAEYFSAYAARSDGDGRFAIDNAEPGLKQLSVAHPDYPPVTVDAAQATRIVLTEGCVLEGTVTQNGKPRPGVSLIVLAPRAGATATPCRTDLDGGYRLTDLAEGPTQIMLTSPVDGKRVMRSTMLSVGQPARVDFAFALGTGVIEGRVTSEGEPAKLAMIEVYGGAAGSGEPLMAKPSPDGSFRITKVPAGTVTLRAMGQLPDKRVRIKTVEVQMGDGETVHQDLELGASSGARISGTLLGIAAGGHTQVMVLPGSLTPPATAIEQASAVVDYMRNAVGMAECTPEGAFDLDGVEPGTYTVVAFTAPGDVTTIRMASAPLSVTSADPLTLTLDLSKK